MNYSLSNELVLLYMYFNPDIRLKDIYNFFSHIPRSTIDEYVKRLKELELIKGGITDPLYFKITGRSQSKRLNVTSKGIAQLKKTYNLKYSDLFSLKGESRKKNYQIIISKNKVLAIILALMSFIYLILFASKMIK